jgi:hypothetical protein
MLNWEQTETYALAAVGAAEGFYKYYLKPELTAKRAWAAIGIGVMAYEMACPPGELLSEGADRLIRTRPNLTRAAIGVTALHLANAIPERIDPFTQGLKLLKGKQ